ncbi:hypothetical protein J4443_03070, partial [Candidatus Woesearchaeota archaeon]|nr:hypothetical protein [Candidatus Woesearchaeota archaeon]
GTFTEGGLARLLEHSDEKTAHNLGEISSSENYPREVNVYWFDPVEEPVLSVSALYSYWNLGIRLYINGGNDGYSRGGCAFGVQKTGEASRAEK